VGAKIVAHAHTRKHEVDATIFILVVELPWTGGRSYWTEIEVVLRHAYLVMTLK